jgi:Endonuclease I/Secretion system C-terminal sorting domain/Abnormal spindle-like microcephaly-assoc'd, ASPM-SPD-2-Hydin
MKLRTFLFACFCSSAAGLSAQIVTSPATLPFGTVTQGTPMTLSVTIDNPSTRDLVVVDINPYHTDAFHLTDTAFTIAPGANHVVTVTCDPLHNIGYADWLLVKSSSHPEVPSVYLTATGDYAGTYYDATQDLWDDALKTSLSSIISTGTVAHTYNESRDQMYMIIDNQRTNGQGALQNTLECIYTGFLAVGYTNRTDAQNTFNLNTEHTMPQSLFGSTLPELSDLHHIFVTTAAANSERGNNPFAVVNSPSWTQGGSKSNGNFFEPRDSQKGPSVRALLYFLFRYQDYQGFICGQQSIIRTWHNQFLPDAVEKKRNEDVDAFQRNRNPFVDHPEFLDRITNLCGPSTHDPSSVAEYINDTLQYGNVLNGGSLDGYYVVANQGTNDLTLSNLSLSDPAFTFVGSPNLVIPKDSLLKIHVRFTPSSPNLNFMATLTFNTDAPATPIRMITLLGNSQTVSAAAPTFAQAQVKLFPQPARDAVTLQFLKANHAAGQATLCNLNGQQLRMTTVAKGESTVLMPLQGLAAGMYLLRLQLGDASFVEKLVVE